jgi:hypothetical protein
MSQGKRDGEIGGWNACREAQQRLDRLNQAEREASNDGWKPKTSTWSSWNEGWHDKKYAASTASSSAGAAAAEAPSAPSADAGNQEQESKRRKTQVGRTQVGSYEEENPLVDRKEDSRGKLSTRLGGWPIPTPEGAGIAAAGMCLRQRAISYMRSLPPPGPTDRIIQAALSDEEEARAWLDASHPNLYSALRVATLCQHASCIPPPYSA